MKIGNLEFKKGIFLAPMAGVTDLGFRALAEEFGAEMCVTEMVSAKALYYGNEKTEDLLAFAPNTKYKAVQIFGNEPQIMAEICSLLSKKVDLIDLNMGCPAPKIYNNKEGSYLLNNIELAKQIISACVKASSVPITVKFRIGVNSEHLVGIQFAKMCEEAGAAAITVHGRTREQFYSGNVDYEAIASIASAVKIPVIGNGDICDEASMKKMFATGVSGVMIGRAAMGNPEIFGQLTGTHIVYSKIEIIERHIKLLRTIYNDEYITKYMRKHFLWYLAGVKNASAYKNELMTALTVDEQLKICKRALESE